MADTARCPFDVCTCIYNATEGKHNYIHNLEQNYTLLRRARGVLVTKIRAAQELVDKGMATERVESWLKDAEDELGIVLGILGSTDNPRPLPYRCLGCYVCFCSAYKLGKNVAQTKERVDRLVQDGSFEEDARVFIRAPVVGLYDKVEDLIGMQATKLAEFWQHFNNASYVRIRGMSGVGKSAFLTKINNAFLEDRRGFDKVIFVDLSKDQDIRRIHDFIGDRLGLSWPENNEERERKAMILRALQTKKFVLLLDDVRDGLSFSDLGVPTPNTENQCKVIFTTRQQQGAWNNIDGVKEIELELMNKQDAWLLFKKSVGEHNLSDQTMITRAERVADLCDGLPLALVIIGQIMSDDTEPVEWDNIFKRLRNSAQESEDPEHKVFAQLSVGYGQLNDRLQKCFLYCSLFPREHPIQEEELTHYWIAEGLLGSHQSLDDALKHGYSIINYLKRVSLLMSSKDQSLVKMHQLIHNMAVWIARGRGRNDREDKFFVEWAATLDELPESPAEEETWVKVKRISLATSIANLNKVDCSNLLTLILRRSQFGSISEDFFRSMIKLKVLDLAWCTVPEFPRQIVKLTTLQYLNLSHSNISSLPNNFNKLRKLKFLDLSFTGKLWVIPRNILSNLLGLQLLNMFYCGFREQIRRDNISYGASGSLLEEVRQLRALEDVGFTIKNDLAYQMLKTSPKLSWTHSILIMGCKETKTLQLSAIVYAKSLKVLHIIKCFELVSLELHQTAINTEGCFKNLRDVKISQCSALKDLTWLRHAEALQLLKIIDCKQLEKVIDCGSSVSSARVQLEPIPFSKLRNLYLSTLPALDSIYIQALPFNFLEEITVHYCIKLRKVPLDANSSQGTLKITCQESWWKDLELDAAIKSRFHPSFLP